MQAKDFAFEFPFLGRFHQPCPNRIHPRVRQTIFCSFVGPNPVMDRRVRQPFAAVPATNSQEDEGRKIFTFEDPRAGRVRLKCCAIEYHNSYFMSCLFHPGRAKFHLGLGSRHTTKRVPAEQPYPSSFALNAASGITTEEPRRRFHRKYNGG